MKAKTVLKPIENEAFWKHHYEQQKLSGMRRSAYCNQNNLNYDRFGYWICKWNRNPVPAHIRKKKKKIKKDIPVRIEIIHVPEDKKQCACGSCKGVISYETKRLVNYQA